MPAVSAQEKSNNAKIGDVSSTYASFKTCPSTCPLAKRGCYAEGGHVGMHVKRLDKQAENMQALDIARQEAEAIRGLSGKRPLRLHVAGDCATPEAARIVSEAASEYTSRRGQPVWTYTHAWRDVDRSDWRKVSVLASVHTTEDAHAAIERGYMPAIVYAGGVRRKAWIQDGVKITPCPQQSNDTITCRDCRLCMRSSVQAIGFHVHGQGADMASENAIG